MKLLTRLLEVINGKKQELDTKARASMSVSSLRERGVRVSGGQFESMNPDNASRKAHERKERMLERIRSMVSTDQTRFTASGKTQEFIEELRLKSGQTRKKDVLNEALEAYDWIIDEVRSGRRICSIPQDSLETGNMNELKMTSFKEALSTCNDKNRESEENS